MAELLTDEEALLAALDEDPANYTVLAALADLVREQGDDNAADWLEWAIENEKRPRWGSYSGWFHAKHVNEGHPDVLPERLWKAGFSQSDAILMDWADFLIAARAEPFNKGSWQ